MVLFPALVENEHVDTNSAFPIQSSSGSFRKGTGSVTEAYRKTYLHFWVLPRFRKLPEASRKAYRKLTWQLLFYMGPGRFPEDRPEAKRTFDISSKPM